MKKTKLRFYREELGKKQLDFARLLRISPQFYNAKENGKYNFRDDEKIIIKKEIEKQFPNITLEELFF